MGGCPPSVRQTASQEIPVIAKPPPADVDVLRESDTAMKFQQAVCNYRSRMHMLLVAWCVGEEGGTVPTADPDYCSTCD